MGVTAPPNHLEVPDFVIRLTTAIAAGMADSNKLSTAELNDVLKHVVALDRLRLAEAPYRRNASYQPPTPRLGLQDRDAAKLTPERARLKEVARSIIDQIEPTWVMVRQKLQTSELKSTLLSRTGRLVPIPSHVWNLDQSESAFFRNVVEMPYGQELLRGPALIGREALNLIGAADNQSEKADGHQTMVAATIGVRDEPASTAQPSKRTGGRKPSPNKDKAKTRFFELMDYHGGFLRSDPAWNCQARAEEKISEEFDISQQTARAWIVEWLGRGC